MFFYFIAFIYLFIYKRVLVGGNQKNYNKLSFIIHNVRLPPTEYDLSLTFGNSYQFSCHLNRFMWRGRFKQKIRLGHISLTII